MFYIKSAALTHPGRKRANNQDFVTYFEPDDPQELEVSGRIYILADGVGGASKGDRASQYAAQKVIYEYYQHPELKPAERLQKIMPQVGNEIFTYAESSSGFMRMATTMVVAVVRGNTLTVANVGDSRAYLMREGRAKQITLDHSLVGEMVRNGTMTEDQARRSKVKNRITRSLGGEKNVHVDIFHEIIQPGDQILLCSDGLTRYANKAEIRQMVETGTPNEVVPALIDLANRRGGADNISAIHIAVGEPLVVEEPTLVEARGETPTLVDWDDIKPDTAILPRTKLTAIGKTIERHWIPIAALVVILIFSIGVSSILWVRSSTPLIEITSSQTPNTTDDLIISIPTENAVVGPTFPNVTREKTPPPQVVTQTSTLTASLTLTVTPSIYPTSTLTQTQNQESAIELIDKAELISEINLLNEKQVLSGSDFTGRWRIKNVGTNTWTTDYKLVFVKSNAGIELEPESLLDEIKSKEEETLNTVARAPLVVGKFIYCWRLQNAKGAEFGPNLWMKISVVSQNDHENAISDTNPSVSPEEFCSR